MSTAVEVRCWSICRYRQFLWWCLEDKEQPARAREEHPLHEYAACRAVFLQHPDSERHDFGNLHGGSRGADGPTSTKPLLDELWVKNPL